MQKITSKILKIKPVGRSTVYDFTVKDTHRILANNFYTSNCSIKHTDVVDFIDAKVESGKITAANVSVKIDDDFMEAVKANSTYHQQFPINSEVPKLTNEINANEVFNKIVHNAWKSAEPGILFWDTIINESVPDCYADLGYKTVSTNPCIIGDTLIATADGRMNISIKELAEEGKDVPVYALSDKGELVIRYMRNPRITGHNQPIYKVTFDDGNSVKVTSNHKFRLNDGSYIETKDLKKGDSLHLFTKYESSLEEIFKGSNSRSSNYFWLKNKKQNKIEHRMISEFYQNFKIPKGHVVHHKDFNSLNNSPDNLIIMSKEEHDRLHCDLIRGKNNPYHKYQHVRDVLLQNSIFPKEKNPMYSGFTDEDIRKGALKLTKKLNRRFTKYEWVEFAKEFGLPQSFSGWRKKQFNGGINSLAKWASFELNLDNIDVDARLLKSYKELLDQGYDVEIVNNILHIHKKCEICESEFVITDSRKREISCCSHECSTQYRTKKSNKKWYIKRYNDLKFQLNRDLSINEFNDKFKNNFNENEFNEIKELSNDYNHKVVSVEFCGYEDVYNGTVDDYHNFFIGEFYSETKSGKRKYQYINNLQCGEIPLCPYDSCRLLAINLYSYVVHPFTDKAEFDYALFQEHAAYAQRIMDDIIDIEAEKIEQILEKIKTDPEEAVFKRTEIELWEKILEKTLQGRRTGIGVTAEGDMLAAMGLTYGTPDATKFSEKIHKILAINVYKASVKLAKERGAFEIYDFEREHDNPFIQRLFEADGELESLMKSYGRRNIALLTIAPTGTTSLMTQTTSGIEPVFKAVYMRRRKINPNDKNSKAVFIDEVGDHWEEYPVFHPKFLKWAKIKGYDLNEIKRMDSEQLDELVKDSPYYKATTEDVDWVEKVRMQGAIQKWVDHSISVTVNLPADISEEIVGKVYLTAWESGCKGVTVYREGSRSGVLLSKEKKKEDNLTERMRERVSPRRPKYLECDIIRFNNRKEKWIGFIGILEGRPYELFTGKAESLPIPNWVECGRIKKVKDNGNGSRYDFIYEDKDGYEQKACGLNRVFNKEYWNIAKTFSGLLRHGMPIVNVYELVQSLKFDGDGFATWKKGLERMIKKYIDDGTEAVGEQCPNCKSHEIVYQDGCLTCKACGWSKCS